MEKQIKIIRQNEKHGSRSGQLPRIPRIIKQAGFNAIELSLVLGVIAIAIVGVIRIMAGNTDKQNSSQMVNDVNIMVANIKNAYSSSNNGYSSLTDQTAIQGKMIPQDLKISEDKILSQFQGGGITIKPDDSGQSFTITYTNVPTAICNSAINTLGGAAFISVKIGDKPVYDINGDATLDASNVSEACSTSSKVDIEFVVS